MTSTPSPSGSPTGPPAGPQPPAGQSPSGQIPPPASHQAPTYQPPPGPRVTSAEVRDLGRLRRTVADRKVAGVAGGIARHLDIDPLIIRVAFVVLSLFGGAGLIVYAACWILLPEDGQPSQPLGLDERSRSVALILVGILGIALLVGQWDWFWVPGPLILVALVVWLVMSRRNESAAAVAPFAPPPGVPNAGPDAVTPEQRWASASGDAPSYDVPEEQQPTSEPTAYRSAYQTPAYAGYEQTYDQQAHQPPAPPTYPTQYVHPTPRNPRKRGPKLFWFTMALAVLAVGVVGIIDVSGAPVADSTYPAVVVGVVGLMLLIGAFYGRAGGLIFVGLLAAAGTAIGVASEKVDTDRVEVIPASADQVSDSYDHGWGEYVLDLSQVEDPEALNGKTIRLTAEAGELDVVVPEDMDVTVLARVNGPGGMTVFGNETGGIDTDRTFTYDGGDDVPEITLDLEIDFGHIDVRTR
jgi:phage shock protein PspC (stress-responsive transcriptional regulator)